MTTTFMSYRGEHHGGHENWAYFGSHNLERRCKGARGSNRCTNSPSRKKRVLLDKVYRRFDSVDHLNQAKHRLGTVLSTALAC